MSQSNGSDPLAAHAGVPIVGQPCTLKSWVPTVMVQCNCDEKAPILLIGQSIVACPACQRRYQIGGIQYHLANAQLNIGINLVVGPTAQISGSTPS